MNKKKHTTYSLYIYNKTTTTILHIKKLYINNNNNLHTYSCNKIKHKHTHDDGRK